MPHSYNLWKDQKWDIDLKSVNLVFVNPILANIPHLIPPDNIL